MGYCRLPLKTRFQPGRSGNPHGRPKGAINRLPALNDERLRAIVLGEAYRTIKLREGDRTVTMTTAQAIVRSMVVSGVKGNHRSQLLFTQLLNIAEKENKELHERILVAAIDYKVRWQIALQRRKELGISGPEPIPHPDNVIIDVRTGNVSIIGPCSPEEKAQLDELERRAALAELLIKHINSKLNKHPNDPNLRERLDHEFKVLEKSRRILAATSKRLDFDPHRDF